MKKIVTLLLATAISTSLFAWYGQSKLSISSTGNANIRVMVDGNKYRADNNVVTISNLDEGYHSIKVFRLQRSKGGNGGYGGNSFNDYQLVYNSRVYVKPQYFVDIVINRFGKTFIDEQCITAGYYEDADDDWGDNWDKDNRKYDDPHNGRAMNVQAFDQFKQSIGNERFDNTKLSIAKQVISTNYFMSAQVKEIVQLFTFESSKLEIAKYAYKYTLDKGSYFLVNDAFTFSNSKDELMQYIQAYK